MGKGVKIKMKMQKEMDMEINHNQTTGQIVVEMKEAIPIFEKYEINYYKEGEKTLKEACLAADAPLEQVEAELNNVEAVPTEWYTQEPNWRVESMASLIHYIVHVHHVRTRLALDNIERALARLSKGQVEPSELSMVRTLFLKLDSELREHLREEEELVFPYLIKAERALKKGEPVEKISQNSDGFSDPIREVLFEHGMMDREFKEIQKLIFLFKKAGDGGPFEPLAETFGELEKDNKKHIHLENNILLKKASQLGFLD
jgi:regulator of cell morphogenesis and NO signaling